MIKPGDRVLALDHRMWAQSDLVKQVCYQPATVVEVYHCENVPLDNPHRILVDLVFDHSQRLARSYFADYLIRRL